ncbi:hypothetical protein EYF80_006383 [Liparis tanakae]|uniref:Uncharacterized protein n=1 Tax=Liparis tanakae TaxID=230148 RepID=A0A4Z2J1K6_9TELE|nr:hypothetical protein EYF80_006383 [Liparis tanakae]
MTGNVPGLRYGPRVPQTAAGSTALTAPPHTDTLGAAACASAERQTNDHQEPTCSVSGSTTTSTSRPTVARIRDTTCWWLSFSTSSPFTNTRRSPAWSPDVSAGLSGSTNRMNWPVLPFSPWRWKP